MMLLDAISEWVEPVSIGPYRARRLFLIIPECRLHGACAYDG